ncbi:hypothetical protein [Zavarzinella formosa]|uniref:hypothetical protein n=1 Tax=Zavarzinella formosa TaxID=360055 RepID=UPI0002F4C626|nr:hypothetical protein [Zavarzinella formosa]
MWHWIKPWHDWLMNEIVTPRRLASQSQAVYYRSEKAGLTLENQPVPWCAEAVVVEALLRLPPTARHRADFTLRWPGMPPVPAEQIRVDEGAQRHRLYFRLPVPAETVTAELLWKHHVLASVEIVVVSQEQFFRELRLELPTAFVSLDGRSVAAQTFVSNQQQGLSACGVLRSSSGLIPLVDSGLTATFRSVKTGVAVEQTIPLTASQLTNREAIVNASPPKLPRKSGEWTITWACGSRELAVGRLTSITPKAFHESLRLCDTRFMVVTDDGRFRVMKQLPTEGVARAGPCFLLASRQAGLAGLAHLEVTLRVSGTDKPIPVFDHDFLVTDGPTPFAPGLLDIGDLWQATAFELRHRKTLIGTLPLSAFPSAHLNAEGGFSTPPDFTWTSAADDELSERLARLMDGK